MRSMLELGRPGGGLLLILLLVTLPQLSFGAPPEEKVGQTDAVLEDATVRPADPQGMEVRDPLRKADFDPTIYLPLPIPESRPEGPKPELKAAGRMVTYDVLTGKESYTDLPAELQDKIEDAIRSGALGDLHQYPDTGEGVEESKNFTNLSYVSNTTTGRYPTHAKLFMSVRDVNGVLRNFVCSATLIDPKHAITAGHCIYFHDDSNGNTYNDWVESVRVVPAYNNGAEPYGSAFGSQLHSWTGWTVDGNHDHDIGIIDLNRPVGALTGWRGYGWFGSCGSFTSGSWEHNGYPSASPYNGQFMYRNTGDFDSCEEILGTWTGNEVRFNNQSWGGQSGSGAVRDDVVRAVLSNGTSSYTDDIRITDGKYGNIGTWISQDTPSSVDFVAMDVNSAPLGIYAGSGLSTLNFLVHNYSSVAWSGTVGFDVYLSTNDIISTADTKISTQSFSWSFTSKSSVRVNAALPAIPASTSPGSYYVGVIITNSDYSSGNNDSSGDDASPISVFCPSIGSPAQFSPASGATCQATTLNLDWGNVSGATSYQVQVGTSCGSGTTYTTTSSIRTVSVSQNTTYWWRVRSRNACGNYSAWTSCRSFSTVAPTPGTPTLVSPANGSSCNPTTLTLDWGGVSYATLYQVQIGTSCGTGSIYSTSSSAYTLGLAGGQTYYWRSRARNACGTYGPWSSCRTLTTSPPPLSAPALASPASGASCQPLTTTVSWNSMPGASSYQVQLGTSCGLGTVYAVGGTSRTYSGLGVGTTYYWRVRGRDACGSLGAWSSCYSFATPQAPIGVGPDMTGVTPLHSLKLQVDWNKDLDAGTAENAGNYAVYETGNPGNAIGVLTASLDAVDRVILELASPWDPSVCYTVSAQNLKDICGNFSGSDSQGFSASYASTQGCELLACPGGDGDHLADLSCEIVYRARDANGNPISGMGPADFSIDGCTPAEIGVCTNGLPAFVETPAGSGDYVFHGPISAGGWTNQGLELTAGASCVSESCLRIAVRSPDINADGRVNLVDVGEFGTAYGPGLPQADLDFNGTNNLVDVGIFGSHNGHGSCTTAKQPAVLAAPASDGTGARLSLSFAPDALVTEVPDGADPTQGIPVYLVAQGVSHVGAWQAEISVSEGVLVRERRAEGTGTVDVASGDDRWQVGLARDLSTDTGVLVLARYDLLTLAESDRSLTVNVVTAGDEDTLIPSYVDRSGAQPQLAEFGVENTSLRLDRAQEAPAYVGPSALLGIAPNPFNPATTIRFHLEKSDGAQLRIYDLGGRLVRRFDVGDLGRGDHELTWHGRDHHMASVASGVYTVRLVARDRESVQRITLIK